MAAQAAQRRGLLLTVDVENNAVRTRAASEEAALCTLKQRRRKQRRVLTCRRLRQGHAFYHANGLEISPVSPVSDPRKAVERIADPTARRTFVAGPMRTVNHRVPSPHSAAAAALRV